MRAKHTAPASIVLFSLLCLTACNDRLFDNPLDPDAGPGAYEILTTIQTDVAPLDLTFSGDALWAVDSSSRIVAINHNSGAQIRELTAPLPVSGIAYDGDALWLSARDTPQLILINIVNGSQIRVLNLLRGSLGPLDYRYGRLYVADRLSNSVIVVDPHSGAVERSIPQPGFFIDGVCHDGADLWTADAMRMKIFRLADGGALENTYQAPSRTVSGLVCTAGIHWCGDRAGKIYKLRFP